MSDDTVTVVEIDGIAVSIRTPNEFDLKLAGTISDAAYRDAIAAGHPETDRPRPEDQRADALRRSLAAGERELAKKQLPPKIRRPVAFRLRKERDELRALRAVRRTYSDLPAREVADHALLAALVVSMVTDESTKAPVFTSLDDYHRRAAEPWTDKVAEAVAARLAGLSYPEDEFLRQHPSPAQPHLAA